jgi:alpha-L-rhamnosidase
MLGPDDQPAAPNVTWDARNFLDVPTDCPQRDERPAGPATWPSSRRPRLLYDADTFLRDWLRDLAAEQGARSIVPLSSLTS